VLRSLAALLCIAMFALDPAIADEPGPPTDAQAAAGAGSPTLTSTSSSWADYGTKAFDVIPIRLLSTCATIVGFGAFIVSVPLVGPGAQLDGIRASWDYFVMGPVDYTFVRPLGEL
jgi:hypothetical protein